MKLTIIAFFLVLVSMSCQTKIRQPDGVRKDIFFKGFFVREYRVNERETKLYLKNEKEAIIEFISMPFFAEAEQALLRKDGKPNVNIVYDEFYNPVRKKTENIVKRITPIYGEKE
jgi:hypothetical protein